MLVTSAIVKEYEVSIPDRRGADHDGWQFRASRHAGGIPPNPGLASAHEPTTVCSLCNLAGSRTRHQDQLATFQPARLPGLLNASLFGIVCMLVAIRLRWYRFLGGIYRSTRRNLPSTSGQLCGRTIPGKTGVAVRRR